MFKKLTDGMFSLISVFQAVKNIKYKGMATDGWYRLNSISVRGGSIGYHFLRTTYPQMPFKSMIRHGAGSLENADFFDEVRQF